MSDGPRVTAFNVAPASEDDWIVGVVAKRTYNVVASQCQLAPEQLALIEAPLSGDAQFLLKHDSELIVNREFTDIIVKGNAYPPSKAESEEFSIALSIGRWSREARVFGDRVCELTGERSLRFTRPALVEKVPLDWASAYGGVDATALKKYGDPAKVVAEKAGVPYLPYFGMFAYPRNPVGKGYVTEFSRDELDNMALPNLEEPTALLTPKTLVMGDFRWWPRAPTPAAFGWLPYAFFPRSVQAGFPIRPYFADKIPPEEFAEVFLRALTAEQLSRAAFAFQGSLRVVQGSAVTMRATEIELGSQVEIRNAHPQWASWKFKLQTPPPQMYLRLGGDKPVEVAPRMHLLVIEPDLSRLSVVWVGQLRQTIRPSDATLEKTQHAVVWRD